MAGLFSINKLIDRISDLVRVKTDQIKLEVMGHVSKVLSHLITYLILVLILFFFAFFITLTIAAYLNDLLDSSYLGYLIVSGVLMLKLIAVLMLLKSGKVQRWLEVAIMKISGEDD